MIGELHCIYQTLLYSVYTHVIPQSLLTFHYNKNIEVIKRNISLWLVTNLHLYQAFQGTCRRTRNTYNLLLTRTKYLTYHNYFSLVIQCIRTVRSTVYILLDKAYNFSTSRHSLLECLHMYIATYRNFI